MGVPFRHNDMRQKHKRRTAKDLLRIARKENELINFELRGHSQNVSADVGGGRPKSDICCSGRGQGVGEKRRRRRRRVYTKIGRSGGGGRK